MKPDMSQGWLAASADANVEIIERARNSATFTNSKIGQSTQSAEEGKAVPQK